jgi:hypothetical protein
MNTIGISPKVTVPAVILAVLGAVLLVLGVVLSDGTLTTAGGAVLSAAGVQTTAGFVAPAGAIREAQVASDDLLSDEAKAQLR